MVHGPKKKITQGIVTDQALVIVQEANTTALQVSKIPIRAQPSGLVKTPTLSLLK